jgi:hypothetical protein
LHAQAGGYDVEDHFLKQSSHKIGCLVLLGVERVGHVEPSHWGTEVHYHWKERKKEGGREGRGNVGLSLRGTR